VNRYQARVNRARNLDELLQILREIEQELLNTGEDLSVRLDVCDLVDVTSLPTFGPAPAATLGVWSWDETRRLVGDGGWDECTIEPRPVARVQLAAGQAVHAGAAISLDASGNAVADGEGEG
jgi:hypothetical protein